MALPRFWLGTGHPQALQDSVAPFTPRCSLDGTGGLISLRARWLPVCRTLSTNTRSSCRLRDTASWNSAGELRGEPGAAVGRGSSGYRGSQEAERAPAPSGLPGTRLREEDVSCPWTEHMGSPSAGEPVCLWTSHRAHVHFPNGRAVPRGSGPELSLCLLLLLFRGRGVLRCREKRGSMWLKPAPG